MQLEEQNAELHRKIQEANSAWHSTKVANLTLTHRELKPNAGTTGMVR